MKMLQIFGGGHFLLRLLIFLLILNFSSFTLGAESSSYKGFLNYIDLLPNQFFTLDTEGNIMLGEYFYECIGFCSIDPTGNIIIGNDIDYLTTKTLKWYRIEGDNFIESPQQLPAYWLSGIVWTPTPFRIIVGDYDIRVWQLDPISLNATLTSEFNNERPLYYPVLVPDLNYLYFRYGLEFYLRRLQYDDTTGVVSGPMINFPTPYRGNWDMTGTSNGRLIVALSGESIMIHRIDDNGVPATTTYDNQPFGTFGMTNVYKARITPDDRFLIIIALDDNNVNSFNLSPSGTITPITQLTGFNVAQALAITPDGKFLVVTHHYTSGYPEAILSVFKINEDGSLTYLPDKDVPLSYVVADIKFFPPQRWPTAAKNWTLYY